MQQRPWKLNPSPIKKLMYKEATSTAFLVEEEGIEVEYDPDEFILKAQNDRLWFRQILLADSFSLPVLSMAVQILLGKRDATGQPHAMLLRSLNIPHTHRVAQLLEDNFPILQGKVLVIHSEHEQYDLAGRASSLLEKFYISEYWVVVHCGMLGVGFDHKWISVSCNLCILKSMSPAEQEWGRPLRKVPGLPPSAFPDINHPNWAVVVTHQALGLRSLFEKFLSGVACDTIKDAPIEKPIRPRLVDSYEAGETVLKLSNTAHVKPGDVLELRVPVIPEPSEQSPKFSLVEELRSTNSLSTPTADDALEVSTNGSKTAQIDTPEPSSNPTLPPNDQQQLALPWQKEVDAISQKLAEIRSYKTYQIQVEAVLDNKQVQISPSWADIPKGIEITKRRPNLELPDAVRVDGDYYTPHLSVRSVHKTFALHGS